jgi:malate synthase
VEAPTVTRQRAARFEVRGAMRPLYNEILTPEALGFLADLTQEFRPRIEEALERRAARQIRLAAGEKL